MCIISDHAPLGRRAECFPLKKKSTIKASRIRRKTATFLIMNCINKNVLTVASNLRKGKGELDEWRREPQVRGQKPRSSDWITPSVSLSREGVLVEEEEVEVVRFSARCR